MFTGIIQGLGEITAVARLNQEKRLTIKPLFPMQNIIDGESIAVNGVCLSVETHTPASFQTYASAETLKVSELGSLMPGAKANLERALELGQRLGGHIVSGHIDCVAQITAIKRQGESLKIRLSFPNQFSDQVIKKGSVALDGISLTVNSCGEGFLEINVIPESQQQTNVCSWRVGGKINMETDIIGKYVQSLLKPWEHNANGLDHSFLQANGFI